jgi:GT2 family glycosyltransferase
MKKLSIIIVHFRKPPILRLCLKSIKNSVKDLNYEVIVVDSSTSEESQNLVIEEFPGVKLIPFKENTGYSKGVNTGIREAEGEYILVLNPDAVITDNSPNKMIELLENNPDIGMVGPALLHFNSTPQQSCFRFYTPMTVVCRRTPLGKFPYFKNILQRFTLKDKDLTKLQDVDWIMGSAMMMRHKDLEKIGLMDERFFMYFEDVDWCRRFWENGLRVVYYPEAKVYHYLAQSSRRGLGPLDLLIGKASRWHFASGMKYFSKYGI